MNKFVHANWTSIKSDSMFGGWKSTSFLSTTLFLTKHRNSRKAELRIRKGILKLSMELEVSRRKKPDYPKIRWWRLWWNLIKSIPYLFFYSEHRRIFKIINPKGCWENVSGNGIFSKRKHPQTPQCCALCLVQTQPRSFVQARHELNFSLHCLHLLQINLHI